MRPNEFKKRPVNDKPEGKQADVLVNLYRVSRFGFEGTIYQYDVSTPSVVNNSPLMFNR
jgi:trehalose/maltose hydrolase-like predicted phosphorylase